MSADRTALCFVDTNIWLYAFTETDVRKSEIAKALIKSHSIAISTQVINEVCVNLIKKAQVPEERIRQLIASFFADSRVLEITEDVLLKASSLRRNHRLSFWDSIIAASALIVGASILYSEDMHDGLVIEKSLTIVNPCRS
jgi:predicted nucleic acid-binding protein